MKIIKITVLVLFAYIVSSCSDDDVNKEVCYTCTTTLNSFGQTISSSTDLCGRQQDVNVQINNLEEQARLYSSTGAGTMSIRCVRK